MLAPLASAFAEIAPVTATVPVPTSDTGPAIPLRPTVSVVIVPATLTPEVALLPPELTNITKPPLAEPEVLTLPKDKLLDVVEFPVVTIK